MRVNIYKKSIKVVLESLLMAIPFGVLGYYKPSFTDSLVFAYMLSVCANLYLTVVGIKEINTEERRMQSMHDSRPPRIMALDPKTGSNLATGMFSDPNSD